MGKIHLTTVLVLLLITLLTGCGTKEKSENMLLFGGGKIVGKDILTSDITDFYYTEENINYDAYYQRYRFYVEDGKHLFFHETRERRNDYGPCTEDDTTLIGTIELTDEQWSQFADLVNGGTVKAREDSAEAGGTGPWLYLYWTNDKGKVQQFSFESYDSQARFEKFCLSLVPDEPQKDAPVSEDEFNGELSVAGPYGQISVSLPDNWSGEAVPVDEGKLMYGLYGLIIKPVSVSEGQIEIAFMDSFGVCGTGLSGENWNLAGKKVSVGTYDNHEYWDYIIFKDEKPQIVAQHTDCDSWTEEMWDEAYGILDSFQYNEKNAEGGIGQYIPDSEVETIGVMMDVNHVTPTGLTVRFRQYDAKGADELIYGEGYTLEFLNKDSWEAVPMIIDNGAFTDIGYNIPPGGESEIETDWEWLYGKLSPGTYKITKKIWTNPKDGDSLSTYTLSAQFMLAGSNGIFRTYEITDPDLSEQYIKDDKLVTMVRYYEMTDGTWKTDDHTYKYRLEITGRMGGGAVKDSTFVYLSNKEEITFDQAWKAAGLSSNMDDYFDPKDAVLVAMK